MSNYNITGLSLESVNYKFTRPDPKAVGVSMRDKVSIIEINENRAVLNVGRELSLGQQTETSISVEYSVVVESNDNITKQNLSDAIRKREISLTVVYSKISLLIGNITAMSPFGGVVTPPAYIAENKNS